MVINMNATLITGGTGTFGRAFTRYLLGKEGVERIIVYSRDEQKQEEMARDLARLDRHTTLRFMVGDVRDVSRLTMAMRGIDTVIHAAALKIVPKCEYDPIEAVRTNVGGAENVIQAAIAAKVALVMALSTDKAVSPVNLYGATKLTAERLFIAANHLSGSPGNPDATRFSVVRYGNVAGSRGSVVPLFKKLVATRLPVTITDPGMTRFWISIDSAVQFVIQSLAYMQGGEVFIPRMPSFRIMDLMTAMVLDPSIGWTNIGTRPGEKIHETLITAHDTPNLMIGEHDFTIEPEWRSPKHDVPPFITYSSDTNSEWLSVDDLRRLTQ
jgi:UDP-N-acetylglucosamine 4,6-dehydratase/5-epimerase